jgi:hypothetical protein
MFIRIKGELKFLRTFTCCRCSASGVGSTETVEVDRHNEPTLTISADKFRINPHAMPVGWANFLDGVRCPDCL